MKLEHELKSGCTKYDQKDMRVYLERKKEWKNAELKRTVGSECGN